MKRTIFILMMLFSASGLMSQSSILIISGHVTDSVSGNPVPGYPVYVDIDSATAGFVYHHVSFAGLNGFYVDSVFFNPSNIPSGIVWVSAWDCIHHLHTTSFAFGPSNLSVTKNFQICVPPPPPCHADFYPTLPPPPPQPLTVHFANIGCEKVKKVAVGYFTPIAIGKIQVLPSIIVQVGK